MRIEDVVANNEQQTDWTNGTPFSATSKTLISSMRTTFVLSLTAKPFLAHLAFAQDHG